MNFKIGFNAVPFNPQVRFSGQPDVFESLDRLHPGPYDRVPEPKDDIYGRFPSPVISMDNSGSVINYDTFTASSEPAAVEIDDTQE